MVFLMACVLAAVFAALLNLWVHRIRPRKPVVPAWVVRMRSQSGRRVLSPDEELFGVMLEKQDQGRSRRVVALFSGRKSPNRRRPDEPGIST